MSNLIVMGDLQGAQAIYNKRNIIIIISHGSNLL